MNITNSFTNFYYFKNLPRNLQKQKKFIPSPLIYIYFLNKVVFRKSRFSLKEYGNFSSDSVTKTKKKLCF